jgi:hypothetical protein
MAYRSGQIMSNQIPDEPIRDILRPTLFRGSKVALFYLLLIACAIYISVLIYLKDMWVGSSATHFLCVWLTFPTIVTVGCIMSRYSWTIYVFDTKLVVQTYLPDYLLKAPFRQEIAFSEIDFIYYLRKEYDLILNYRDRLKKFKIHRNEMDYQKKNLIEQYGVLPQVIESFEKSSQKALSDDTATKVLMVIEGILVRSEIQKGTKKEILKDLKKTDDFTFEHVSKSLSPYEITQNDLDEIKDAFSDLDVEITTPFLVTKYLVAKAKGNQRTRGELATIIQINNTLVLSNKQGDKKVYLKRFHSLSRSNWQKLIHIINEKKSGARYLMSRQSYRNISDPDFKPGRM